MVVTASEIFARSARIIGARTGVVLTGSSTTSVPLGGLVGTTGTQTAYAGHRLILPAQAAETDKERFVTAWSDPTGTATVATLAVAPSAGAAYILVPREDYTLNEYRLALGKALEQTPRTYRYVIPYAPLLKDYYLPALDWLTGDGDIDAVFSTLSPLMLHNEDMSLWQNGAAAAPDGYTLSGTNPTVTRVSGGIRSGYAATIAAGASALCRMTQSIPKNVTQWITRRTFPVFTPMRAAAWVSTTDADSVRIFIYDGTTRHYSDYILANGVPQFPSLSLTPDEGMTDFQWGVEVAQNATCVLHWAGLMQNTSSFDNAFQLKDSGSQANPYDEMSVLHVTRNIGGQPMVELGNTPSTWGQLIVYSRRKFPAYSSDSDSYDDQYARVLTAGTVSFLLEAIKPSQDRDRLDRIRREQAAIWTRMANNISDIPVDAPPVRMDVMGA